jgi:hypothetical protein
MRAYQATATAIGLSFMFAVTGVAFAATSDMSNNPGPAIGTTSGPADGTNVSTAPQKMQQQAKKSEDTSGGPGVEGKPGNKSGPSVKPNSDSSK